MPDRRKTPRWSPYRTTRQAEARCQLVVAALERPRTQAELRDALGMSNSGILHLLRRLERDGLIRPAERICGTRVWERTSHWRGAEPLSRTGPVTDTSPPARRESTRRPHSINPNPGEHNR